MENLASIPSTVTEQGADIELESRTTEQPQPYPQPPSSLLSPSSSQSQSPVPQESPPQEQDMYKGLTPEDIAYLQRQRNLGKESLGRWQQGFATLNWFFCIGALACAGSAISLRDFNPAILPWAGYIVPCVSVAYSYFFFFSGQSADIEIFKAILHILNPGYMWYRMMAERQTPNRYLALLAASILMWTTALCFAIVMAVLNKEHTKYKSYVKCARRCFLSPTPETALFQVSAVCAVCIFIIL
jgi:hypothetical protein